MERLPDIQLNAIGYEVAWDPQTRHGFVKVGAWAWLGPCPDRPTVLMRAESYVWSRKRTIAPPTWIAVAGALLLLMCLYYGFVENKKHFLQRGQLSDFGQGTIAIVFIGVVLVACSPLWVRWWTGRFERERVRDQQMEALVKYRDLLAGQQERLDEIAREAGRRAGEREFDCNE